MVENRDESGGFEFGTERKKGRRKERKILQVFLWDTDR